MRPRRLLARGKAFRFPDLELEALTGEERSRAQILAAFLTEAAILSGSGGLVGLALGFALDRVFIVIYPAFPVKAPLWAVTGAMLLSVIVGIVFGLMPARRAARLDPVAALGGG